MIPDFVDAHCALVDMTDDGAYLVHFPEPVMHLVQDPDAEYKDDAEREHWTCHEKILACRTDEELGRAFARARKASLKIRDLIAHGKIHACEH